MKNKSARLQSAYKFDCFSKLEWEQVYMIVKKLSLISTLTLEMEATDCPTIHKLFPYLLKTFNKFNEDNLITKEMEEAVKSEFVKKIAKYFGISNKFTEVKKECKVIIIASALDPRTKCFEYAPQWKHALTEMCKNHFKSIILQKSSPEEESDDEVEALLYLQNGTYSADMTCEVERYFSYTPPKSSNFNILHWWRDHSSDFPLLSKVARDILAIPASSSLPERIFSKTSDLASAKRNKLSSSNFKMACFINSNKHLIKYTL